MLPNATYHMGFMAGAKRTRKVIGSGGIVLQAFIAVYLKGRVERWVTAEGGLLRGTVACSLWCWAFMMLTPAGYYSVPVPSSDYQIDVFVEGASYHTATTRYASEG
ncbi:hypothetical protein GMOD_00008756 [Pyrenophora seminiperda CCB06]|uniref:Uncharacterized protein n=1 Tax=Pyrenophora seminiperda CCB06 TaxID=1302712 RepID=A0A3M7M5S4_9PLEO|nr:hypothetical protein GMOD_00008756 [Pyrenophora seminiperda CCB06]